jgi:hypothetical protein
MGARVAETAKTDFLNLNFGCDMLPVLLLLVDRENFVRFLQP